MISMNCSPPCASDGAQAGERCPPLKARIRNSDIWTIGSATRVSMTTNDDQDARRPPISIADAPTGSVQPVVCPPWGCRRHRDGDQDRAQPDGEGDVAPPVDAPAVTLAVVAQLAVGPDRAEDADGDVDPEHRTPVPCRQQTARDQPDELAGQGGHLVEAEREAAPLGREASVRMAAELAVSMEPPVACSTRQPMSHIAPCPPANGSKDKHDGREREDREAGVVDTHPAEHVAETAQRDHQHGLHQAVSHDHPEQIGDVAGIQRVQVDAPEDGGQRDDDDRSVQRRHEDGGRGVRQGDPGVAIRPRSGGGTVVLSLGLHRCCASRSMSGAAACSCAQFGGGEAGESVRQLLDAGLPPQAQCPPAAAGDAQQHAASVRGVGMPGDETALAEAAERHAHRLRTDLLLAGQLGRSGGAAAVQPRQRRRLGKAQVTGYLVLPQLSAQQADVDEQRARHIGDVDVVILSRHNPSV